MEKRGSSGLERIDQILMRMVFPGGRRLLPDSPQGPCSLCGEGTTHADSIIVDEDRKHFSCREKVAENGLRIMIIQQDALSVCEALGKDGILAKRLEKRLEPYLRDVNADKLCRMITFSLAEIGKDPSIRPAQKAYIAGWLADIRDRYIPSTN